MTPADLPAAIRAMEARKIPDMQAGIDFNDKIGVPRVDPLETKDVTGTISTPRHSRVRFRAGSECGEGLFEEGVEFDGYTLTIEVSGEADALAMVAAIKADHIAALEAQLAEARQKAAQIIPAMPSPNVGLRDRFAGQALAGMLANADIPWSASVAEIEDTLLAKASYELADAMIAERSTPPKEDV